MVSLLLKKSCLLFLLVGLGFSWSQEDSVPAKQPLDLAVLVGSDYITIGIRGDYSPKIEFKQIEFNGNTRYAAVKKNDISDSSDILWSLYAAKNGLPDSVFIDSSKNFLWVNKQNRKIPSTRSMLKPGMKMSTLAMNSERVLTFRDINLSIEAPLSVFDLAAKDLQTVHSMISNQEGADHAILAIFLEESSESLQNSWTEESALKKLQDYRPLAQAMLNAGFKNIWLTVLAERFNIDPSKWNRLYEESYRALGLTKPAEWSVWGKAKPVENVQLGSLSLHDEADSIAMNAALPDSIRTRREKEKKVLIEQSLKKVPVRPEIMNDSAREDSPENVVSSVQSYKEGSVIVPSENDIILEKRARSVTEICKLVGLRVSIFRDSYNKFLKKKPGFAGTLVLKLAISSVGEVTEVSIVNSETGFSEFDEDIKSIVSRLKFARVLSGDEVVTFPLVFTE